MNVVLAVIRAFLILQQVNLKLAKVVVEGVNMRVRKLYYSLLTRGLWQLYIHCKLSLSFSMQASAGFPRPVPFTQTSHSCGGLPQPPYRISQSVNYAGKAKQAAATD